MDKLKDLLNNVNWIKLCVELGVGLFVLISFVRCALAD